MKLLGEEKYTLLCSIISYEIFLKYFIYFKEYDEFIKNEIVNEVDRLLYHNLLSDLTTFIK